MPAGACRRPVRAAVLLLAALLVTLAAPALARAQSLTISVASDPVAGLQSSVDYEYDTGEEPLTVTIVERPSSGPECQPTSAMDAALVGAEGAAYVMPAFGVSGASGGHVPYTFSTPGSHRLCAWLSRTPDDVVATAVATAQVRPPNATLTITATPEAPRVGGSDVQVHATGSIEAAADLLVTAVQAPDACPPTYDVDSGPRRFDVAPAGTPTRVTGAFDLSFDSRSILRFGRWTICAYLQDGDVADTASATAAAPLTLMLKPGVVHPPRVRRKGHWLTCDGGRWHANPKPKLRYAWLAGVRKLHGHGRRLAITHAVKGKAVRCRVTAANPAGRRTATSRALRVR